MEIKYFKLIKSITEEGSIANSAEKLFLTQSALSHQLKELETQLGVKVFHRKRNEWELTNEGKELYKLGCKIIAQIDSGLHNIQQLKEGTKGTIKVSTECYSFYHGLPKLTQKIGLLYPNINVELNLEATHKPISKILTNEIDIAIVTSPSKDTTLLSVPLFEDEIFVLMHKEHSLAHCDYIKASDFTTQHLIIHSYPLETVSVYEHFLKPKNCNPLKTTAIPLTEIALEMVNANMGIICMPKWALESFNISSEIKFKRLEQRGLNRTHYLVYRNSDSDKKYIQDFVSSVQEHFTE